MTNTCSISTRGTSTIFVIMVVAATTLMLLTSNTITGSVLAQKQVYPITAAKAMAKLAASGSGNSSSNQPY